MVTLRQVIALFVVAFAILAVIQFTLPGMIESRIESELARTLPGARLIRAEVEAFPAVMLLLGRLDRLDLDVRGATFDGLIVDAALIDGRHLVVDTGKLLRGQGVAITSASELRTTLAIAEDDLNEYLWSQLPDARGFRVSLDRGEAALKGALNLFGRQLQVHVSGYFRVDGPTQVVFIPEEVSVENARVPQVLIDLVTQEWEIGFDFGELPFGLVIEELRVENGQLLIYGARPVNG